MSSLVEIDPLVLKKKMKMWKVYDNANDDNDDNNDDNDWQRTNFDQKSSLEHLAQVSLKPRKKWTTIQANKQNKQMYK